MTELPPEGVPAGAAGFWLPDTPGLSAAGLMEAALTWLGARRVPGGTELFLEEGPETVLLFCDVLDGLPAPI